MYFCMKCAVFQRLLHLRDFPHLCSERKFIFNGILADCLDCFQQELLHGAGADVMATAGILLCIGGTIIAILLTTAMIVQLCTAFRTVEDEFGEVGPQDYLQKRFGLTANHIIHKARKVLSRKR